MPSKVNSGRTQTTLGVNVAMSSDAPEPLETMLTPATSAAAGVE